VGANCEWVARNKAESVCHVRVKGKKVCGSGGMKIRNVDADWVVGGEEDVRTKST
jgi:hypothetical protein